MITHPGDPTPIPSDRPRRGYAAAMHQKKRPYNQAVLKNFPKKLHFVSAV